MVVKTLLKILEKYPLNNKGVKVQFVGHTNPYGDTIYEDCVLVTPIANDGETLHYRSIYMHNPAFKKWELRSSFYQLVNHHNKMNCGKADFVPIYMESDYVTFR